MPRHNVPRVFGDRIFENDNHLIIPSIRQIDGEERFKIGPSTRLVDFRPNF